MPRIIGKLSEEAFAQLKQIDENIKSFKSELEKFAAIHENYELKIKLETMKKDFLLSENIKHAYNIEENELKNLVLNNAGQIINMNEEENTNNN